MQTFERREVRLAQADLADEALARNLEEANGVADRAAAGYAHTPGEHDVG